LSLELCCSRPRLRPTGRPRLIPDLPDDARDRLFMTDSVEKLRGSAIALLLKAYFSRFEC